jgi:hypothetical protein
MNINESLFNLYIADSDKASTKLMILFDNDQAKVDEVIEEFKIKVSTDKAGLVENQIRDTVKAKIQEILDLVRYTPKSDDLNSMDSLPLSELEYFRLNVFKTLKNVKKEVEVEVDGVKQRQEVEVENHVLDYSLDVRHKNNPLTEKSKVKSEITVSNGDKIKPDGFKDWTECLKDQFPKAPDKFKGQSAHTVLSRFLNKGYVDASYKITDKGTEYNNVI